MKIKNLILALTTVGIIGGLIQGIPVHASTIPSFKLKLHLVDKATEKQIHDDVVVDAVREEIDGKFYDFEVPKINGYIPELGLYIRSTSCPTSDSTFSNSNVQPESTIEYDTYETSLSKNAVPPNTSHWIQVGNNWYYSSSLGTYTKGWKQIGGKWYFLDKTTGAMKTGWIEDSGTWYYMYSDGSMATNTTISGYYVNENGAWVQNSSNISTTYNQNGNSQIVTFVDKNLEQVVRNAINKSTGTLYKSDVVKITELLGSRKGISSLSGIENLVNLHRIDLSYNKINSLSGIEKLIHLQDIDLDNNQIKDISVLKGLNLSFLYMRNNQINDISALKGQTHVHWFFLDNNQISDISPLEGCTNLEILSLKNNQISYISALRGLTKLQQLNLGNNHISDYSPIRTYYNNLSSKDFDLNTDLSKSNSNTIKSISSSSGNSSGSSDGSSDSSKKRIAGIKETIEEYYERTNNSNK